MSIYKIGNYDITQIQKVMLDMMVVISSLKYVDKVIPQVHRDKIAAFNELKFDVMFVGSDWKNDPLFVETEKYLSEHGAQLVFLPYTNNISSTKLRKVLDVLYGKVNKEK